VAEGITPRDGADRRSERASRASPPAGRFTTPAQLEAAFVARGASGDTVRKSIAFMLAMAKDAGVELSPHLTKRGALSRKLPQGASRQRIGHTNPPPSVPDGQQDRRKPTPHIPLSGDWLARLVAKFPDFDPAWNDELKAKWFETFERLLSAQAE
jgi:hypothetical protein